MKNSTIHEPHHLFSLYHKAEDYFFSAISKKYRYFNNDACAYITGVEADSLNLFIVKQYGINLDVTLQNGIQLLDDAAIPFNVILPSNMVDKFDKQISDNHFSVAYISNTMYLNLENYLPLNCRLNSENEIRCTNDCLVDWAIPIESAFESNTKVMAQYQARHQFAMDAGNRFFHFSLYVKTEPVCSLTLSINNQLARLDDIGTKVEFSGPRIRECFSTACIVICKITEYFILLSRSIRCWRFHL